MVCECFVFKCHTYFYAPDKCQIAIESGDGGGSS